MNQLKQVLELTQSCSQCSSTSCQHVSTSLWGKLNDLTHQRTIKPFLLIGILFLIMQFTGMMVMRPYYVQILDAHGITVSANLLVSVFGVMGILANICIMISIRTLGKRRIYLYSMALNCICSFGLSKCFCENIIIGFYPSKYHFLLFVVINDISFNKVFTVSSFCRRDGYQQATAF